MIKLDLQNVLFGVEAFALRSHGNGVHWSKTVRSGVMGSRRNSCLAIGYQTSATILALMSRCVRFACRPFKQYYLLQMGRGFSGTQ